MSPPRVVIHDHFPDDANWQLLPPPLDRSDFLQKAMLQSEFFAEGFNLINPTHDHVVVTGTAEIVLENPQWRSLGSVLKPPGSLDPSYERIGL